MDIPVGGTKVPVAIVGMACRLPGADNLEQYWQLLHGGGSAVAELPHERLDQSLYYDPRKGQRGKTYCKLGAIVSSRKFDSQACPIPKALESGVDNAHLLMCEVTAAALRHAGYDPFNLRLRNTGVYIGHAQGSDMAGDMIYGTCIEEAAQFLRDVPAFRQLSEDHQAAVIRELVETVRGRVPQRGPDSPDLANNMVAGTISKAFGLTGPFVALNSACASSLQAIQLAVRALQLGRIDMAIAGGASDCKAGSLVLFSYAQSMSETGTRPFDADADGLICSEGYVALALKTLPRALADGDRIQAIIPGLGTSSDGRGKSLWAPRKEGQVKAMERAYRNGLDMSTLQYIEAHATSTSLGDATELNALRDILSSTFPPGKKIPITSVKANIGHALEAAGIAGVIKTVLCLQHRTFVPAINIRELNPKIDWDSAPFYIPRQAAEWPEQPDGLPRRAAVNAFGIGGLNMHLVLEEFTEGRRESLKTFYQSPQAPAVVKTDDAVAVIGMGCILPGAADPRKFWDLLVSGRDPKQPAPEGRWRTDLAYEPGTKKPYRAAATLGGYITDFAYDWKRHKLPPKQVQQADPLQFMFLEAAEQALIDSGYDQREFDRTRTAVFVGTESGGDFGTQLGVSLRLPQVEQILAQSLARRGIEPEGAAQIAAQYSEALLTHWPALIDESGSFSSSTLASRITKTMNLMGGAASIDASDASSAAALAAGVDLLLSGDCDMVFCAGGQRCMNLAQYEGMTQSGVLSSAARPPSPFDAAADGIVPGEGVGVVLLKRLSAARRDGDRVQAIIRGIGAAHGASALEALPTAIDRALTIAGVDGADVALVEIDGTGLRETDQQQLQAIVSTYGRTRRQEPLLFSSATAQIGHVMGASAMAHFIKASLEVETGQMPRAIGLDKLPPIAGQEHTLRPVTSALEIRHTTRDGRRLAAVSSFCKGLAFHIVLERGEPVSAHESEMRPAAQAVQRSAAEPAKPAAVAKPVAAAAPAAAAASSGDWRILRLGAATPEELDTKLQQARADVARSFATAANSGFAPGDQVRVAIVANSAEKLGDKLQVEAKQWMQPAAQPVLEQQGCFYRQVSQRKPRVAFLFPGQGSQYPGMLRELVRDVPAAAAAMREFDAAMVERGFQTFAGMAWEKPEQLGKDIWVTQVVMLLADLILYRAVVDFGIEPDLISSHSYGEFAALAAAGVWDFPSVLTAARARYDAIEATPTARGTMMATTAPPQVIESVADTLPDRAYVANYNAPDQAIVGGRPETLQALAKLLDAKGFRSQLIAVPCPFHTPLMHGVGAKLQPTLDALSLDPPRVPFLSSVSGRFVAEPGEIRLNLAAQLTTPVRYLDQINRIAGERDTVFFEIGPQQALTKLNRRILDGRSIAGIVATDNPKRPGVEQILHVRALLECVGALESRSTTPRREAVPAYGGQQGAIVHVDATVRRRDKMRQSATRQAGVAEARASRQPGATPKGNGTASHVASQPWARPTPTPAPQPAAAVAPPRRVEQAVKNEVKEVVAASKGPQGQDLEKFLINFVVEQTGYPPEVVELDADLEADLGIDSIKKAQLFGELAEYFDVQPTENMTLDDFPTLRHVLNFLGGASTKDPLRASEAAPATVPTDDSPDHAPNTSAGQSVIAATVPAAAKAGPSGEELEKFLINFVVEQTGYPPEVVELDADLEADLGIDSIKKAQLFGELAEYFDVQPTENMTLDDFPTLRHVLNFLGGASAKVDLSTGSPTTTAAAAQPAAPAFQSPAQAAPTPTVATNEARTATGPNGQELEKFLINFVVEQTGYPPEVVELDADLEADLGIDSIKKAQLFGELAEYFDVQPTENMTLDDFPTLRHVLNFLGGAATKDPLRASSPAPAAAPTNGAAPHASMVASDQPLRETNAAAEVTAGPDADELERFLINFVVEQTGYPPEVVELDADLEADLGIDSIKKAQLFGELAEYFDVQPTENMTLDDFPTLRHVLNFLRGATPKGNRSDDSDGSSDPAAPTPAFEAPTVWSGGSSNEEDAPSLAFAASAAAVAVEEAPAGEMLPVMRLHGTPYQMGLEHGWRQKDAIRRILRRLADLTDADFTQLPIADAAAAGFESHFTADELDELQGIAHAVRVPLSNLLALNLAIDADLGSVVSHAAVTAATNLDGGLVHAASVELPLCAALSDFLSPVIVVRSPLHGHAHAMLSFAGLVGGLCGINSHRLAITTGILSNGNASASRGRGHAMIASRLLAAAHDVDSAIAVLQRSASPAGWNACLSHGPTDRLSYVESDGARLHVRSDQSTLVAANHASLHAAGQPADESGRRLAELESFASAGKWTVETLDSILASPTRSAHSQINGAARATGAWQSDNLTFLIDAGRGELWIRPAGAIVDGGDGCCPFALSALLPPAVETALAAIDELPDSSDLAARRGEATQRFVMRMIDAPLDTSVSEMPQWQGAALVVGENPSARALCDRLRAAGVVVCELKVTDDLDAALAELDRLWAEQPLPHLFLMTGRDPETGDRGDDAAWSQRRYRAALLPYFLCQRWVQRGGEAKLLDRSTLVAATSLNGDIGFTSKVAAPENAALGALTKAIYIEFAIMRNLNGMIVKSIDSPDDEQADLLAANICRELASKAIDFEVAYVAGRRRLQCAYPQDAPLEPHAEIRRGGTWVLTGGARGITAECALALGRRFGLRLHLIGTQPLPHLDPALRDLSNDDLKALKAKVMREARASGGSMDEAWSRVQKDIEIDHSLRALSDAGIHATYHACDVADRDALAVVLDAIRRVDGPIEGIIHGAGIERACKYERKTRESVMATIAAKVDGAMNLMRLTWHDPVRYFIGFGSISGRMGSNGQTDYCLASDLLVKLAAWYRARRPGVRSMGFHWHPWSDVGMAARPESATAMRLADGPAQMPKDEGIRHLLRELYAGMPETEVLITSLEYHGRYYGTEHHPQPGEAPKGPPADGDRPGRAKRPADSAPAPSSETKWQPSPVRLIASRHTLLATPAPLPADAPAMPRFEGGACILGSNPAALALRERLVAAGVEVQIVSLGASADEAIAAIEAAHAVEPFRNLFLLTGRDEADAALLDPAGWQRRRADGVVAPFLATQAWFRLRRKAKDTKPAIVVAATAMGGDFGLSSQLASPEGGALAGLLKSLYIEDTRKAQRELTVKVVDTPADESPAAVADAILRELAAGDPNVEVGWSRGKRSIIRSMVEPIESLPNRGGPRGGTWIVTGGARGITAAAAFELARRFGVRLHIIGRSEVPREDAAWRNFTNDQLDELKGQIVRRAVSEGRSPERDWERVKCDMEIYDTLRKFADAGVRATYHSCDLADWNALAKIVDEIRRTDGPIEGIVHGAGWGKSGRFDSRSRADFERTIAGKLDGAVALMSLCRNDPVRYWIGFGSISGRFGGNGLSDYAAANDMLGKLVDWHKRERPDCAACCFHWQSWDEVGMATRGDSAVGTKGVLKMDFLSPKEGVEHLCREIAAGLPAAEVLITDGFFERTFYPSAAAAETGEKAPAAASGIELRGMPLVESMEPAPTGGGSVATIQFDPTADPFLLDHKLRDTPLLPAVIGLESLAEAASLCRQTPVAALRHVQFTEGLRFHTARKTTARVRVGEGSTSVAECALVSDFHNRAGAVIEKDRLYVRGLVEVADVRPSLSIVQPQPPTSWQPFAFQNAGPMYHGPSFHGVTAISTGAREAWGRLIAQPLSNLGGSRAGKGWIIPAALIDAAFYVCGIHVYVCVEPVTALPESLEAVRLGRLPRDNESCLVRFDCRDVEERHVIYDFTIFGDDGSAIVAVDGYRCAMLKA